MKIRKALQSEAADIAKVSVDSWRTTYRGIIPDAFLDQISYEQRTENWAYNLTQQAIYVAENEQGGIVGFADGGPRRGDRYEAYQGEIYAIYILQEYQRKGLGKKLLQPVVEDLQQAGMHSMIVLVLEDNPSKYFYEAAGAKCIDRVEIGIAGTKLNELVYAWDKIDGIFSG
ncbi:GNAT family N-acetyltransferase [Lentibacillus sediminis]|uniref:GNAT family N-acetyltransferase n=1 Tax=Lentibacillus sediminis TaxID=1940529 RepID=UPI000C1C6B36|nr:GNAT family N-acetyltransferase [Lentibacillus sediminis]